MSNYHWVGISVALIVLVLWGLNRFIDSKNQLYDPTAHMPRARTLEDLPANPARGDRFTSPIYALGLAAMQGPVGDQGPSGNPGPTLSLYPSLKIPVTGDIRSDSTGAVWYFDGTKWSKVAPTVRTPDEHYRRHLKVILG